MHELYPFYIVTVKLRDEARPGSSWTMMFEDDTVVCGNIRKSGLERRGMTITWCKMGCMWVNERDPGRMVTLQGLETSGGF